jgi:RNA polymerase sigma factor (sigma-70 family)
MRPVQMPQHLDKYPPNGTGGTLGHVLYANPSQPLIPERDWVGLVHAVAAGDPLALHALHERTHRVVFTLIMRITSNRNTAEDLTLDVYHDIWARSSAYDARDGTVLAWIMNLARSRAIHRLRINQHNKRVDASPDTGLLTIDMPDYRDALALKERNQALRTALTFLTPAERKAIEAVFFSELAYDEVALTLNQPVATVKTRIRSALHKLRGALTEGANRGFIETNHCPQAELVCAHALWALPATGVPAMEVHLSSCRQCRRELEALRPIVDFFVSWPTDVLRPWSSLQGRLAQRIAAETGRKPVLPPQPQRWDREWEAVAPGISCKLLATDTQKHVVSMLVRLAPGGAYPPHIHAGVEELHLLDGELWIDDRKLHPGDYNRAEAGTGDKRVWSQSGCTCVLVTSTLDVLS